MALKKRTKILIGGGAVAVAAIVAAVGINSVWSRQQDVKTAVGANGKELTEIRTYTRTDCGITPYLVADQLGFFEEEGVKLVFTGTLGYEQQLSSVISGDNDIGDAHPNELALFIQGGAKVKGVSRDDIEPLDPEEKDYRHMKYFVAADSPIQSWEDLKTYKEGQQILINGQIPSCMTFVPGAIFDKFGLDRDRIKYVTFDSDQQGLQAVSQGDIDIAQVHPPFYKLAQDSGLRQIGDSFDAGLGATTGTALYYFSDQYIEEHPDRVQAFVNAITKAQIWANKPENRKQAAEITAKELNVDSATTHYYADNTDIIDEELQPWIDDLVTGGFLKEGELAPADLVTHQFYNEKIKA